MKSLFLLGMVVAFLNANTNKEYYTLKIIRKNAPNSIFLSYVLFHISYLRF